MSKNAIKSIKPMKNGILKVVFETGNSITVDMSQRLSTARFGVLKDTEVWESADTDGNFVHWYQDGIEVVELSFDEIMQMTVGGAY
ncbi:MAG: DUF2442 domain-containing protein [Lachnospiraceae bacterium]|nr:DUF2442 domain-containing protein [Lachnospiraceae bacterium]